MQNDHGVDEDNANLALLAEAAAAEHALTPLRAMRKHWRALFWCNFMCIGAFSWGYANSAPSHVSFIGGMFGSLYWGVASDRMGRRGAVAVACILSIVGVLIQLVAPSDGTNTFLIGKLINGFALSMFVSCASTYSVEVSPLALRGITTAAVSLWIVLGQLMSRVIIWGTYSRTHVYAYRFPLALQCIFPILLLIGIPFAPESPWWLVRGGRLAAAERVITHLGGPTVDVTFQRQRIQETFELEDSYTATSTYIDCFRGQNLKRTIVAMMVFVLQRLTGVDYFSWFIAYHLRLAGFVNFNFVVGVTAIKVVGNLLIFWTAIQFRRRFLFHLGMTVCALIFFVVGPVSWSTSQISILTVFALTFIYNLVYQASVGPLAYVLFAEVSSAKLRPKTVGIGICTNLVCGMLVNAIIPHLTKSTLTRFAGCAIFSFLGLVGRSLADAFLPETHGRTVDELDLLYEKRVPASNFASHRLYDDRELEQW